ncbi:hypothetical protein KIN20_035413 [Parelaphostrongylus tenuis]|uniref:Uncharacterized protein n=1 Tax=Parelaphostrongylus tenuis TaxID=148309 RepID=A0AAD5RBS5_PARTN|nr:hypothetical protein KIN20_035413 [Parelaphostrongylus tenuis]
MKKEANQELETTSNETISRHQSEPTLKRDETSDDTEKKPFVDRPNSDDLLKKNLEMENKEENTMAINKINDIERNEDIEMKLVHQNVSILTKKLFSKQNLSSPEIHGVTDIRKLSSEEEKSEFLLHKMAIEYLKAKIELLEKQLMER